MAATAVSSSLIGRRAELATLLSVLREAGEGRPSLAFVVGEEVPSADVQTAIRQGGGALLTNIELFDIYRGQPIPAGHKSLAYKLTYESLEGNLSEARVQDLRNRIIRRVSSSVGGALRE